MFVLTHNIQNNLTLFSEYSTTNKMQLLSIYSCKTLYCYLLLACPGQQQVAVERLTND